MASSDRNTKTYGQARRLLELIDEIAPTSAMLQRLLEAGDVLQAIAECKDLNAVDRVEVIRLFHELSEPSWVDFETQLRLVQDRAIERRWLLSGLQKGLLVTEHLIGDHPQLTDSLVQSLDIWAGADMEYNWEEMTSWLAESLATVGMELQACIKVEDLRLRGPGSDYPKNPLATVLKHAFIDLDQIAVPRNAFLQELGKYRPRLDLLVLLAMNPSMCKLMGTRLPVGLAMTGFCDEQNRTVPIIERFEDTVVIDWFNPS